MSAVTLFVSGVSAIVSMGNAINMAEAEKIRKDEQAKELRHKILGYNLELYAKYVFKYGEDWAKAHAHYTIDEIEREEKSLFKFLDYLL